MVYLDFTTQFEGGYAPVYLDNTAQYRRGMVLYLYGSAVYLDRTTQCKHGFVPVWQQWYLPVPLPQLLVPPLRVLVPARVQKPRQLVPHD